MSNINKKIEYLKTLPRKLMGAGVLLFDDRGRLLILKPSYKEHWTIPGGVVEEYESPIDAVKREAKEETNLDVKIIRCLAVDFLRQKLNDYINENLQIIFLGKNLTNNDIKNLRIDNKEIIDFKFVEIDADLNILGKNLQKRLRSLNNNFDEFVFMEDGKSIV